MTPAQILAIENGGYPSIQVWGTRGMASSMHPVATDVAAQVLREGGNAVDAAVALGAAVAVTSHDWSGPAGDSAWLVYLASSGEYRYLDGYSTCSAATTPRLLAQAFNLDPARDAAAFREEPAEQRHLGVVTGMVPGTPAAWCELTGQFGRLPLARLLEPAIALAENGVVVNRYLAQAIERAAAKLAPFVSTRALLGGKNGGFLREGETLKQSELGATLRRIAAGGRDGFYKGETAALIAEYCRRHGGTLTLEDLAGYQPRWRPVFHGSYRGRKLAVSGPPTAGAHVIQALNVLEGYDLAALGYHSARALHLLIEALKRCLADRRAGGGDPDFQRMDVAAIIDKAAARELRKSVSTERATSLAEQAFSGSSTTHFAVADAEGNLVSATQTIGSAFGCGEMVAGTGMLMNDRTWWMALEDGPNTVAPGHRANIGHAPTLLAEGDRPCLALGSPGGFGIVQYVVQTLVNVVDYGLDLQAAIEAPRFKIEDLAGRVAIERRVDERVRKQLEALGHRVQLLAEWTDRVGGVEGVYVDPVTGNMLGGYDPRRNSSAAGVH